MTRVLLWKHELHSQKWGLIRYFNSFLELFETYFKLLFHVCYHTWIRPTTPFSLGPLREFLSPPGRGRRRRRRRRRRTNFTWQVWERAAAAASTGLNTWDTTRTRSTGERPQMGPTAPHLLHARCRDSTARSSPVVIISASRTTAKTSATNAPSATSGSGRAGTAAWPCCTATTRSATTASRTSSGAPATPAACSAPSAGRTPRCRAGTLPR